MKMIIANSKAAQKQLISEEGVKNQKLKLSIISLTIIQ